MTYLPKIQDLEKRGGLCMTFFLFLTLKREKEKISAHNVFFFQFWGVKTFSPPSYVEGKGKKGEFNNKSKLQPLCPQLFLFLNYIGNSVAITHGSLSKASHIVDFEKR